MIEIRRHKGTDGRLEEIDNLKRMNTPEVLEEFALAVQQETETVDATCRLHFPNER
jgi:hypothetical protein